MEQEVVNIISWFATILGISFILSAVFIIRKPKQKASRCSSITIGQVIRVKSTISIEYPHITPIVQFFVNGEEYTTEKKYTKITLNRFVGKEKAKIWLDKAGCLRLDVPYNMDVSGLIDEFLPVGTTMEVHYNPDDPNDNYVGEFANHRLDANLLLFCGVLMIAVAFVVRLLLG